MSIASVYVDLTEYDPQTLDEITGCKLYLGPDYTLGSWVDRSSNALNLTQATGSEQPASVSGVPTFDGGDILSSTGRVNLIDGYTLVIRFSITTAKNYNGLFRNADSLYAVAPSDALVVTVSSTGAIIWSHWDFDGGYWQSNASTCPADGAYRTLVIRWKRYSTASVRLGGTEIVQDGSFTYEPFYSRDSLGPMTGPYKIHAGLGYDQSPTIGRLNGRIRAMALWDRVLTDDETETAETLITAL
jgi:hypothetical protein